MNHCLDCNSRYEKPGTCNCYAPGGKRAPKQQDGDTVTITITPRDGTQPMPWYPARDWPWSQPWTVTATECPNCGGHFVGSHVCMYYNPHRQPVWLGNA